MSRLLGPAIVVVVALALASAAAATPGTRLVRYMPFDLSGRTAGVHVDRTVTGSCFAGSIAIDRPDAWRCTVGNQILDPCLQAPEGAAPLICVAGRIVVRLRLAKALPEAMRNTAPRRFSAWRLVLRNGDVCDRFTGTAAGTIAGHDLAYGCRSGATTTDPVRGRPFWTVSVLPKGIEPSRITRLGQLKVAQVVRALGLSTQANDIRTAAGGADEARTTSSGAVAISRSNGAPPST